MITKYKEFDLNEIPSSTLLNAIIYYCPQDKNFDDNRLESAINSLGPKYPILQKFSGKTTKSDGTSESEVTTKFQYNLDWLVGVTIYLSDDCKSFYMSKNSRDATRRVIEGEYG